MGIHDYTHLHKAVHTGTHASPHCPQAWVHLHPPVPGCPLLLPALVPLMLTWGLRGEHPQARKRDYANSRGKSSRKPGSKGALSKLGTPVGRPGHRPGFWHWAGGSLGRPTHRESKSTGVAASGLCTIRLACFRACLTTGPLPGTAPLAEKPPSSHHRHQATSSDTCPFWGTSLQASLEPR